MYAKDKQKCWCKNLQNVYLKCKQWKKRLKKKQARSLIKEDKGQYSDAGKRYIKEEIVCVGRQREREREREKENRS